MDVDGLVQAIASVNGAWSLLAFLIAAVVLWKGQQYANRVKLVNATPESERAELAKKLDDDLHLNLDLTKASKRDTVDIVKQALKYRQRRFYLLAILPFLFLIVVLAANLAETYLTRSDGPPKPVSVQLRHGDADLKRDFTMIVDYGNVSEEIAGKKGRSQFNVPDKVTTIRRIDVKMLCFDEARDGPHAVVAGKDIEVEMEPVVIPPGDPYLPEDVPDWEDVVPRRDRPNYGVRTATKPDEPVIFSVANRAGNHFWLYLVSYDRVAKGIDPYRDLYPDPCNEELSISEFYEDTGWFSFIAKTLDGDVSYLGTRDLFSSPKTKLIIDEGMKPRWEVAEEATNGSK